MKKNKIALIFNVFVIVISIVLVLFMTIDFSRYDSLGYHYILIDLIGFSLVLAIIGVMNWIILSIGLSISYLKNKTISKTLFKSELILYIICIFLIPISIILSYVFAAFLGTEGDSEIITRATIPYAISFGIFTIKFITDFIIYKKANK